MGRKRNYYFDEFFSNVGDTCVEEDRLKFPTVRAAISSYAKRMGYKIVCHKRKTDTGEVLRMERVQ